MKKLLLFIVLGVFFALSACNLPSSGIEPASPPAELLTAEPTGPTDVPSIAEPTDLPRTSESPSSGNDPCLQGNWIMPSEDVNSLMQRVIPIPNMSFRGSLTMSFSGNEFTYASDGMTIRVDMPGGYMEADAIFLVTANFSTNNGVITLYNTIADSSVLVWRGMVNGDFVEVPGPINTLQFPSPDNSTYVCTADTLTFQARTFSASGPSGFTEMTYRRQP